MRITLNGILQLETNYQTGINTCLQRDFNNV